MTEPLIRHLQDLRLRGNATALAQLSQREHADLPCDKRLGLLIQHDVSERASARSKANSRIGNEWVVMDLYLQEVCFREVEPKGRSLWPKETDGHEPTCRDHLLLNRR